MIKMIMMTIVMNIIMMMTGLPATGCKKVCEASEGSVLGRVDQGHLHCRRHPHGGGHDHVGDYGHGGGHGHGHRHGHIVSW